MAFSERSLDDYVDVAERIAEFYDRYPDGSLQPADPAEPWSMTSVQGFDKTGDMVQQTFIVYVAAAYRTPDDARPGIGVAWEIFPGRTPYTRGSEVMNAETSAWGRAIAALGIATKKGIASRQEVANRRSEREDGLPTNADGTLSRSRTTDEQKDAAGVMTSAQQAAHTALQPKRAEMTGKVTRIRPDDPWQDQPAGDLGKPVDKDAPGTIGPGQLRRLQAAHSAMERGERLGAVGALIGREIGSFKELSFNEASKALAGPEES